MAERFQKVSEGAPFLPGAKDERTPSPEGAFLVSATLHREAIGGGVLVTVGVWSQSVP